MRCLITSVRTRESSDIDDFLGFSCGVVEFGADCEGTAFGRGAELAIGAGFGSASG